MGYTNYNHSSKKKQSATPIYSGGRAIGSVQGQTFKKVITGSKHMLRQPPAIAVSCDALEAAIKAGATRLEVVDRETATTYRATIEHFQEAGFEFDRGFGRQFALSLDGWTRSRRGGSLPVQAALFEGVA